jgi:3-oxoadipyl-CoA thiolase
MKRIMNQSYICDAVRTPVGKFCGSLSTIRPDDLIAMIIKELVNRNPNFESQKINDVIIGCANQAGEDNRNIARMAVLLAGLPWNVPGETINRLCSSGLSSVINASRAIQTGDGDVFIAGGVESMTRAPFAMAKSDTPFSRNVDIYDTSIGWRFVNPKMNEFYGTESMGETAENVAEIYKISRDSQDLFAYNSQQKAVLAKNKGIFKREIMPVLIHQKKGQVFSFDFDEFIREDTSLEALSKLKPAFRKGGSVTAGNSSGINDGAAALIIASEKGAIENALIPKARIVSSAVVGVEPKIMGIGPVEATRKALQKAGLKLNQIDVIELNEAFAAQSLACIREWGLDDDDNRINPNGGAIAIGHPLGMTGARLLTTAMYELIERKAKYAICTLCIGVGQGYSAIIENVYN